MQSDVTEILAELRALRLELSALREEVTEFRRVAEKYMADEERDEAVIMPFIAMLAKGRLN